MPIWRLSPLRCSGHVDLGNSRHKQHDQPLRGNIPRISGSFTAHRCFQRDFPAPSRQVSCSLQRCVDPARVLASIRQFLRSMLLQFRRPRFRQEGAQRHAAHRDRYIRYESRLDWWSGARRSRIELVSQFYQRIYRSSSPTTFMIVGGHVVL